MKLKKIIILSVAFCSLMTTQKVSALISDSQLSTLISEPSFRACVLDTYNSIFTDPSELAQFNLSLGKDHLAQITELKCQNDGITSTEGIQYLTGLQKLDLGNNLAMSFQSNSISTIDLSKNTKLTELYLIGNDISTIDLSKNTALTKLSLSSNNISTIDLSKNTALTSLDLSSNKLTLGEKLNFKEYVKLPQGFKTKVSYTSSNPEIATVDENGNISGVKEGTTTITFTSKDKNGNLIYEVNEVTVTKKAGSDPTTEKTNNDKTKVKNPETSDKGMIYGGGLTLTIGTIIAIRKKLKLLGI